MRLMMLAFLLASSGCGGSGPEAAATSESGSGGSATAGTAAGTSTCSSGVVGSAESSSSGGVSGCTTSSADGGTGGSGGSGQGGGNGGNGGNGGISGAGAPEILSDMDDNYAPFDISVDDSIYWTNGGTYSGAYSMPKSGGASSIIDTNFIGNGEIVATASHVYWSTGAPIIQWDKSGPASQFTPGVYSLTLATDGTSLVALHADSLNSNTVRSFDLSSGTLLATMGSAAQTNGYSERSVAIDQEETAFWTSGDTIQSNSIYSSGPPTVVVDTESPVRVAVDDTYVYWTSVGPGSHVSRALKDGSGSEEVLADSQASPMAIVVDSTHVYWTKNQISNLGYEVDRCPKSGGPIEVIASANKGSTLSAADDMTHIYWIVGGTGQLGSGGQIWRAAK